MSEKNVINEALAILESRLQKPEYMITGARDAKNYLTLKFAEAQREIFSVMFLDTQHGVIETKEMFHGTIDAASVYPREVVKAALERNAAAVIISHNHPSGRCAPSQADYNITEKLKAALSLVDIPMLDHIIVGGVETYSFKEHGML